MKKYFIDTCIWRDFYENRFSKAGNPLGKYATDFFLKTIKNKDKILFSDTLIIELGSFYNKYEIYNMLNFLFAIELLVKVEITELEFIESKNLCKQRNIPLGDCITAVQARNHNATVITQDNHFFNDLKDIALVEKP
ncbi:MAG: PIN domain-containing protein [archaeon]